MIFHILIDVRYIDIRYVNIQPHIYLLHVKQPFKLL